MSSPAPHHSSQPPRPLLAAYRALARPHAAALLAAAAASDGSAAQIERLRRSWPAEQVTAALDLVRARRMLEGRIDAASTLMADPAGAEQASSTITARWKARRFARLSAPVADLCCGIGGDLLELSRDCPARGIDLDPLRAWMAEHNTGCSVSCEDARTAALAANESFHLDPARRDADGRRRHDWDALEPGPALIEALIESGRAGAVKLGPGIDWSRIPSAQQTETEVIGEDRRLVQAVLWTGSLAAAGMRTATRLPQEHTLTGVPCAPPPTPQGSALDIIHLPDPALERAELVGAAMKGTPLGELHPGIGLLTGAYRASIPPDVRAWLTSFRVIESLPFRLDRIASRLSALGAGTVEVRTRGHAVDADAAQRHFGRGGGHADTIVFGLRLGQRRIALITRPDTDES